MKRKAWAIFLDILQAVIVAALIASPFIIYFWSMKP